MQCGKPQHFVCVHVFTLWSGVIRSCCWCNCSTTFYRKRFTIVLYSQYQRLKQLFCSVYKIFGFSLCGISLCPVTAIRVDRLMAVQKSLQYPSIVTIPRVNWLLVAIWTICIILASAHFWQQMVQLVSVVLVICACLCISADSHVKIFKAVRHHVNNMSSLKKSAFNAFLAFLVLVICYSPFFILYMVTLVHPVHLFLSSSLTSTIVFINSSLNPFLYCWRLREVRQVVKQTFTKLVCCK